MIRRLAFGLLLLWSVSALAQEAQRPDFSGTWMLDKAASRLQIPAPDNAVFYIEHSLDWFRLTRALVKDGEADMLKARAAIDGDEMVENWGDGKIFHRCRREGERLVLETRNRRRGQKFVTVAKLSLSPDGKTLTIEESFSGSGKKHQNTWVLQWQPPATLTEVTEDDLRQIKAAGLWYYVTKQPHAWQPFTVELGRGAYFPAEGGRGPSIGIFELKQEDGRLALVRQPPPEPPMMVYFGFFLVKLDGQWIVLDEYFMEEWISFVEEE